MTCEDAKKILAPPLIFGDAKQIAALRFLNGPKPLPDVPDSEMCGGCEGMGINTDECNECSGEGTITCPSCDGEGHEISRCLDCDGQGWVEPAEEAARKANSRRRRLPPATQAALVGGEC
jgi:hypothetical protein